MEKIDYKGLAAKIFCYLSLIIVGWLFFKYVFGYFVPFLVAWAIAYIIYPLALKVSKKTKMPRKVWSFVITLVLLMLIILLLFLMINRLVYEIQNFLSYLNNNSEKIAGYIKSVFDFVNSISNRLPIINKLQNAELISNISQKVNELIENIWQELLLKLGSAIPNVAAKIVMTLPDVLFVGLICTIAAFYFALDIDILHIKLKEILPSAVSTFLKKIKSKVIYGFKKYVKAYLIIFIITFLELFVGFLILGVDYYFIFALLIAFIDFLPVFGTGAVLVPWGIIALLMKNYYLGIGMLILFTIVTILRQIIEPKILGKSLGVHPLLTLLSIYLGYKIFGVFGMFFLPFLILLLSSKEEKSSDKSG